MVTITETKRPLRVDAEYVVDMAIKARIVGTIRRIRIIIRIITIITTHVVVMMVTTCPEDRDLMAIATIVANMAIEVLIAGIRSVMKVREVTICLLYTSPSPRDGATSRMPSSA